MGRLKSPLLIKTKWGGELMAMCKIKLNNDQKDTVYSWLLES